MGHPCRVLLEYSHAIYLRVRVWTPVIQGGETTAVSATQEQVRCNKDRTTPLFHITHMATTPIFMGRKGKLRVRHEFGVLEWTGLSLDNKKCQRSMKYLKCS